MFKKMIRENIFLYRCFIILFLIGLLLFEITRLVVFLIAIFCVPGVMVRFIFNGGKRTLDEKHVYLRFVAIFLAAEYVWNGFQPRMKRDGE